jgi:N-acetylmuramoyl-L-alanine amidase
MRGSLRSGVSIAAIAFTVAASFAVSAPTAAAESLELMPVEGFHPLVSLDRGAEGPSVIRLQYSLRQHGFYRGPVDGVYGRTTAAAVIAFEKYFGLPRTGDFGALDWIRIGTIPSPDLPYRWDEPDRVEIDLASQLLYVIRDQEVVGIVPTSTGSGGRYYSVRSGRDFELDWHQTGWNCDSVTDWCVYNYWGFTEFYGIHGFGQVPPFPASHGCSRVSVWDSDWLEDHLFVGMPVHVWREKPLIQAPPSGAWAV